MGVYRDNFAEEGALTEDWALGFKALGFRAETAVGFRGEGLEVA